MRMKDNMGMNARKRKFRAVLPLLVLPFVTLLFWALGGGTTQQLAAKDTGQVLNLSLPDASIPEAKMDKMSYYEMAVTDSLKRSAELKNDPNYPQTDSLQQETTDTDIVPRLHYDGYASDQTSFGNRYQDANEAKVYKQLSRLNAALAHSPEPAGDEQSIARSSATTNSADIDRLEQMMQVMNQKSTDDPEMQQLNGMLENILDIQHPERVRERIQKTSAIRKSEVFTVSAGRIPLTVSSLDTTGQRAKVSSDGNGFYSLAQDIDAEKQNAVRAVIHETQSIVNGSTVKLRLADDVYIAGVMIPKDNFLFGTATLNGERLVVRVGSVRYHNSLFPVELAVYDLDGLEGIYIPGAIPRDVAKESSDRVLQNIGLNSLDASLGAQAASAGIEAVKTFMSKKVKLIRVTVKAGYQVLLRDEKQKDN